MALLLGGTERPAWLRPRTIAAREVIVQVMDADVAPVAKARVEVCRPLDINCYPAAITDENGRAKFEAVTDGNLEIHVETSSPCPNLREFVDIESVPNGNPVLVRLDPTGTLHVRIREVGPDGAERTVSIRKIDFMLHPRPALPYGMKVHQISVDDPVAHDAYDLCLPSDRAYDVSVEIEGYYPASSAEPLLPSGTVRDATFTVRRKPSP